MNNGIKEALAAARETKALEIGRGAIGRTAEVFSSLFPDRKAVIVADRNTFEAAGRKVAGVLSAAGVGQDEPFVFDGDDLYAEYGYVERLAGFLAGTDAIPLAVGSGTINDLVKLASHQTSRSYVCVATAASMDGYTAFGASITRDGKKQTFSCPAPAACIADIDVLTAAPREMAASGYGDLFAKVTAGADWILADALGIEPIDATAWKIVQGNLRGALADPEGVRNGGERQTAALIDGLMLGGFAMQSHRSSRPASGAEHQFSHLWNMEHHTNGGETVSHGFQVAVGTLAVTALYEKILETPFDRLDVESCVEAWPEREALLHTADEMFRGTDFPGIGREEAAAKYPSRGELRRELITLRNDWPQIRERLCAQIVPYAEAKRMLALAGAPSEPEQTGVSREYLRRSFIRAQFIRRRYTALDLAVRTNMMERWLDGLFGPGAIWDTNA